MGYNPIMDRMKISLLEMDIHWQDRKRNLRKAVSLIRQASALGSDIAVLPEMFTSGFSMSAYAEPEDGETFGFLSDTAKRYSINIVAGYAVKSGNTAKNMAFVFDRRGVCQARYAKLYPFSYAGEHRHYQAGKGPVVFKIDGIRASVFICYDLRFPEAMRQVAKDISMAFVIANWPKERMSHFNTLLRARAIENQCFVIGVNRIGVDGNGLSYSGGSKVFDPWGQRVQLKRYGELLLAVIRPAKVQEIRQRFPFLMDMK